MTPEERKQAFANEYNELVKKYGVVVVAKPNIEQMSGGEIVIKLPTVDIALVDNWQPEAVENNRASDKVSIGDPNEMIAVSTRGHKQSSNGNKEKA